MPAKKKTAGFSDFEREAMQNRAKELAAEARTNKKREDGEKDVLEAIAAMPEPDRGMANKIHELITKSAPSLWPKTWYGMPAYAKGKDDKVICFFQSGHKFKARYALVGFNDSSRLDDGNMWPTAFALKKLTAAEEAKIVALVKKAMS
jgi:uncharacterized protein YdhG (YjbR/CyaY superfamily)